MTHINYNVRAKVFCSGSSACQPQASFVLLKKKKAQQYFVKAVITIHLTEKLIMANFNPQHSEGKVASAIEEQTAKLPSDVFLWASIASMGVSLTLKCLGKKHTALFVGQWAAPFLLLGIYNKIVKVEGHD